MLPCHRRVTKSVKPVVPILNELRLKKDNITSSINHHRHLTERLDVNSLSRNVLRLEVDVGAALRQRSVVASETEEKLRDACENRKRPVSI